MRNDPSWSSLARRLKAVLQLTHEPVAVAFAARAPAGVSRYDAERPPPADGQRTGSVAAGCCFWTQAEESAFTTTAEDHANCSVGSYTHGLLSLEQAGLRDDTQALLASGWLDERDLAAVAAVPGRAKHVSYGPLVEAAFEPEVVLIRLRGSALMTLHSACPELRLAGKPQCQIVPLARERRTTVASLGCAVSRARTGLPEDEMTCAVPAAALAETVDRLEAAAPADRAVAAFARADRERFTTA